MNIKTMMTTVSAAVSALGAFAEMNDWENPAVNSTNRLPARVYTMPLADAKAAFTSAIEPESPYRKSLNGNWKISWTGDPALRVKGFEAVGFDDGDWLEVDVPSCLELRGFGSPGYVNTRFPTANTTHPKDSGSDFAKILDRDTRKGNYNPVASYRTRFAVPKQWAGRRVILRFDGVASAYYVWVNGRKIGYAEDSKLPSEFDVTEALKDGDNLLAVEVFKWCDGSFVEDQDMFRYHGIIRDVTLWSMPKDGIWDFAVRTALKNDYRDATIALEGIAGDWTAELYDAGKALVAKMTAARPAVEIKKVNLWSAEKPYLYTLIVKKGSDIRSRRIGFKEQKVVGNTVLVNGRKIKFKGVNRHETNPDNGRTVSMDDMLKDITLFKRYNINTVRTCHYPDHHSWYDLCDLYGIYVVAEADVEGHEAGYGEKGLGLLPEWWHTIVERNERNVVFHRDNPSVVFWSMGNETGHGDGFRKAIAAVKALDGTRIIHWERGNEDADVDSTMYPSVEWCEKRGKLGDVKSGEKLDSAAGGEGFAISGHTAGKPFFMCEYAHAMGNAIGNFREYWEVFYRYDAMTGGCIWDWVDQAVWKYTDRVDPKTGKRERYFAYGGDSDEEPNDGPFCCNGVVDPLRNVSAKLIEVGHVHRNLVVERGGKGAFSLWNRFGFTVADEFDGKWEIVEDGAIAHSGVFAVPAVKPLSRGALAVPELEAALAKTDGKKEVFVNFSFLTKRDEIWAKRGWCVAKEQIAIRENRAPKMAVPGGKVKVAEDAKTVTVNAGATKAVFCRKSGTLCELVMNGKTVLKDLGPGIVSGPQLTCARAFTDNDRWMRDGSAWGEDRKAGSFMSKGLSTLSYHVRPIKVAGNRVTIVTEVTGRKSAGFTHTAVWTFGGDGRISISNEVLAHGDFPPAIPRLGLSLRLDKDLERLEYYGRGPYENYIDRLSGSFLGIWKSTVTEQFEPYVRPQDNGYKSDVRWIGFVGSDGKGVKFTASEPMFVQALHYGWEDFDFARHRSGQKRFRAPLVSREEVCLNLDVRQTGLGGGSCGPWTMEKYQYHCDKPVKWTLEMSPFAAK